jgi:hypothetical protein
MRNVSSSIKIVVSLLIVITSIFTSDYIFVSKTESYLFIGFALIGVSTLWRLNLYKLFFVYSGACMVISVLLLMVGVTEIRFSHYVDKSALWSFYSLFAGALSMVIESLLYMRQSSKLKGGQL